LCILHLCHSLNFSLGLNFVQRGASMQRCLSLPPENSGRARHAKLRRVSSSDACFEN
jgi:hypothetical protein